MSSLPALVPEEIEGLAIPVMDARRNHVYAGFYQEDQLVYPEGIFLLKPYTVCWSRKVISLGRGVQSWVIQEAPAEAQMVETPLEWYGRRLGDLQKKLSPFMVQLLRGAQKLRKTGLATIKIRSIHQTLMIRNEKDAGD